MPQAHGPFAEGQKPLEEVVDGQIAGGAGQHLLPAADCPANQLHHGGRFAGAWRPVKESDVSGRQRKADGLPLRGIESGVERRLVVFRAEFRGPPAEQDFAEFRQAVPHGQPGPFQGRSLPRGGHVVAR